MAYYVTFYSYKGGVGRTLTLLNVAVSLVRRGKKVFIWELDLEAPGILNVPPFDSLQKKVTGGTVDLLTQGRKLDQRLKRFVLEPEGFEKRLLLLPAGVVGAQYPGQFAKVPWDKLFGAGSTLGSELFEEMRQGIDLFAPDFVLIDSRTGLTDIGAICTVQLPDTVVLVYGPNRQNVEGAHQIQVALTQVGKRKDVRREPMKIQRVLCPAVSDHPEMMKERLEHMDRLGLTPDFQIPFRSTLIVKEEIYTHLYPEALASKEYENIAQKLVEMAPVAVPAAESRVTQTQSGVARILKRGDGREELEGPRGKSFEEKVTDILRLMDMEVEWNTHKDGRQIDFIAKKRDPLQDLEYVGECKDYAKPVGVGELDGLHSRLAGYRREHPAAQGMLVALSGFTAEVKEQAQTLGILLRTYGELLNNLVDLRNYNTLLIQDVEGKDIERLYVEPDIYPERDLKPHGVMGYVDEWLADPSAVQLTLLGDFGTGKTWFTRKLACELAKRYREDASRHRQPIRINLRDVAKALDLEGILFHHFQMSTGRPVNPKAVLHLLSEGRYVLIFDGFDEMATQANWDVTRENFRQLIRAAEGKAKIILTCRTHYFREPSQVQELLAGQRPDLTKPGTELHKEIFGRTGFHVGYLAGFNEGQIEEYLGRACGAQAGRVGEIIGQIEGLRSIATRPVFLDMIVQSAPKLEKLGSEVRLTNLYEAFTEEWFQRQDWRLRLTKDGRRTLVEELAAKLWQTDEARIHYTELADVLAELMRGKITSDRELEMADYEVRTASFLTRDERGNYGFSHRSFLEFFLASRLARVVKDEDAGRLTEGLRLRKLSPAVVEFLGDLAGRDAVAQAACSVLGRAYGKQSSENALVLWEWAGRDGLASYSPERIELEGAELAGYSLAGCYLERANLRNARLTGAMLSKARLGKAVLAGAELQEAVLGDAQCRSTDFQGADLSGADLTRAYLRKADFRNADLSFATLIGADTTGCLWDAAARQGMALVPARQQMIPVVQAGPRGQVTSVEYSPDGKLLAVATGSVVEVFDTATGQCRRVLSGHQDWVGSVAWRGDGRQIASGSEDKTVRVWDVESGSAVRTLSGHEGWV
ncbi:MAG: pentapeptide repeat-containing protein, partial [Acidobacteriia bacterium]|nr:pentapeptide repeat-containing protein [Terriglobia bacterium]